MKNDQTVRFAVTGMLITFLVLNGVPALYAEEQADAGKQHPRMEKFLEKNPAADTNSDGKVDRKEFHQAKKEAKQERREQFLENHPGVENKLDKNNDGNVGPKEWKQGRPDKDNNPPGPRGGAGTNWENRPGPQGGPGTGPDRGNFQGGPQGQGFGRRDFDNNPPGPRGGAGTNWENRPGPQGGPGAGPNRGGNLRTSGKHDSGGPVQMGGNRGGGHPGGGPKKR